MRSARRGDHRDSANLRDNDDKTSVVKGNTRTALTSFCVTPSTCDESDGLKVIRHRRTKRGPATATSKYRMNHDSHLPGLNVHVAQRYDTCPEPQVQLFPDMV